MVNCANSEILDRGTLSLSFSEVREGERHGWDEVGLDEFWRSLHCIYDTGLIQAAKLTHSSLTVLCCV